MTVDNKLGRVQYTANGVTTNFVFAGRTITASDLVVYFNGVLKTLTSDYTISGLGTSSATITTTAVQANGVVITIARASDFLQQSDYIENEPFPAESHERALDKLTIAAQQLDNRLTRALVFPDALTGTLVGELPQPEDGKLLAWSGTLGKIISVVVGTLANLTTAFSGLAANDFLVYNGSNWVNRKHLDKKGTTIASATTTDIGAADSDFIDVSGTTTITSLGATINRDHVWVNFTGALLLTHNATSLILPSSANITTAAGDVAEFVRVSGSNWKCTGYTRADGTSVGAVPAGSITFAMIASAAVASLAELIAGTASKLVSAAGLKLYNDNIINSWVRCDTNNGAGSSNGAIRRFTNSVAGSYTTDITYADSATLGASFTINTTGTYAITYTENFSSTAVYFGVSKNTANGNQSIFTNPASELLAVGYQANNATPESLHTTVRLAAGDVIRPHLSNSSANGAAQWGMFLIKRVG